MSWRWNALLWLAQIYATDTFLWVMPVSEPIFAGNPLILLPQMRGAVTKATPREIKCQSNRFMRTSIVPLEIPFV
mgnify:CR=1